MEGTYTRLKKIKVEGKALSEAFNIGLENASGDIILNICDDDMDLPHRAAYLVEQMEKTGADIFLASYNCVDENGNYRSTVPVDKWDVKNYLYNGLNMPLWSGAYRKSTCPRWREDFLALGDYCFFLDSHMRGLKIETSHEVVANIRHWPGQMCAANPIMDRIRAIENKRICQMYNLPRLNR